jgi:hypothetical protein
MMSLDNSTGYKNAQAVRRPKRRAGNAREPTQHVRDEDTVTGREPCHKCSCFFSSTVLGMEASALLTRGKHCTMELQPSRALNDVELPATGGRCDFFIPRRAGYVA